LHKSAYILILLLTVYFTNSILAKEPISDPNQFNNQFKKSSNLLHLWDSINNSHDFVVDPYAIGKWDELLSLAYADALTKKQYELAFQISIPLSFTYHSESKFSKGIPLLEKIFARKNELTQNTLKEVLIKLEEEYRAANNIEKAILIRKQRIAAGFINNYWEIYKECGLFEAAKKDLIQFEPIPTKNTTKKLQYIFLLGDLYLQMKQFDSAKLIYVRGLQESNEMLKKLTTSNYNFDKIMYWKGCFLGLIEKCNIARGNYNTAIPNLLYDIKHSKENIDNKINKMIDLSKCYLHLNKLFTAKIYLDSVTVLLSEKISKPLLLDYFRTKSDFFSAKHEYDSALYYYHSYNNYRDTLQSRLQQNQSILLLVQLEVANRRAELLASKQSLIDRIKENDRQKIMLLILILFLIISITLSLTTYFNSILKSKTSHKIEAQNILINANAAKMEAQFNHNEILLKELHHRVKNNLQVMYSLLNLQKRRNTDIDTIETLSSIQNRIHTMALVHQNLYNSGEFEMVEILNYIRTLTEHLSAIYKIEKENIEIVLAIKENIKLPIETVVAIGLIINEAVSNSFKYAFKNIKKGLLLVKIVNNELDIEITIEDNGNGLKSDFEKENSLGMKLINLMCLQLKATHIIKDQQGITHFIKFNKT